MVTKYCLRAKICSYEEGKEQRECHIFIKKRVQENLGFNVRGNVLFPIRYLIYG